MSIKITVEREFISMEAAAAWLGTVAGTPPAVVFTAQPPAEGALVPPAAEEKPKRKPRADRGQAREPYGPRNPEAKGAGAGAPSAAPAATPAPEAASAAAPAAVPAPVAPASAPQAPAAATPVSEAELTETDTRAALKAVSDTEGLGMPACMGVLNTFGVQRISLVPKADYAEFIAHCKDLVARAKQ